METLSRLAALTEDLSQIKGDAAVLMQEHLESARQYKMGSMPEEYLFNLRLVKQLAPAVEDPAWRSRINDFLHSVEAEEGVTL